MENLSKFENTEQIPAVKFIYDKDWDLKCLINKGPGGIFSPSPTKVYKELLTETGENPTQEQARMFIDEYLEKKNISGQNFAEECNNPEIKDVLQKFKSKAEAYFGVTIPEGTKCFLTVNNRCPYDIESNWFYATISSPSRVLSISMHELWHFYTWYKFGKTEMESEETRSKQYGDMKEALTVLLNPECLNLLPEGERDNGYPQHKELREKIVALWKQDPDIEFIWESIRKE